MHIGREMKRKQRIDPVGPISDSESSRENKQKLYRKNYQNDIIRQNERQSLIDKRNECPAQ